MPTRISGQSGLLTINGLNANPTFGVTSCKLKSSYTNADVTVTSSGAYEEYIPIVRGKTYEIEVPFDAATTPLGIEAYFESLMFPANGQINLPAVSYAIKAGNTTVRQYSGLGMLESFEINDSAKDAVRVIFTVRMTGTVTIT